MPIAPHKLLLYPPDWKAISARIRFERAQSRCECDGRCGTDHGGRCDAEHKTLGIWQGGRFVALPSDANIADFADDVRVVRCVLTCAHIDHRPQNCDPTNLLALCARCHLNFDRHYNRLALRLNRMANSRRGQTYLPVVLGEPPNYETAPPKS